MRRRRSAPAGVLLAVVLALVAAGCSNSPHPLQPSGISTSTLPSTAIKLESGGTVTVGVPYLPTNFNPSSAAGANRVTDMVMAQVWPQSFVIDPQFEPETTGFLDDAELVSLSPETIAYHIDPGAKWSDGVPISVADFVYNWQQQLLHAAGSPLAGSLIGYADIASITGSNGGKTVTIRFKRSYADWEGLFQNLVPAHVAERVGWNGFDTAQVGDVLSGGPFEITSYVPGSSLTLTRNPAWWGTPAHLESIVFRIVTGGSTDTWNALSSGRISVGEVTPEAGGSARAETAGLDSATTLSPVLWQLTFNLTDAELAQPAIRSAIAQATDRTELVADTIGLADPGIPVADNRIYLIDEPGWSSDSGQYATVNVLGAQSLLEAAGYQMSPAGYLERGGQRLVLTVTAPSGMPVIAQLEAVFQAQMKDVGIVVQFRNVPLSQLLTQVLPSSDYQLALAPYVGEPFTSWTQELYNLPGTVPALGAAGASGASGAAGASGATGVTGAGSGSGTAAGGAGAAAEYAAGGAGADAGADVAMAGDSPGLTAAGGDAGAGAGGAGGVAATLAGAAGDALSGAALAGQPLVPGVVTSDVSGLSDPTVASLYAEAEAQIDPPTAHRLYNEIDSLLWADLPTLPLFQMPVTLVTAHDLVNVQESPTPVGFMWNAQDWAIALNLPAPTTSTG